MGEGSLQARCARVVDREVTASHLITPVRAAAAAVTLLAAMLVPEVSVAAPAQTPEEQQEQVRQRQGEVQLEIDTLTAEQAEVAAALTSLETNVATQEAELASATEAAEAAAADVEAAEAEVVEAQARVDALNRATDQLVVDSFVAPPSYSTLDALEADNLSDATVMKALVDLQAQSDAQLMEDLEQAQTDLEEVRDEKADVAAAADEAKAAEEGQLAEVQAARDQQAQFAADAQAALDQKLGEMTFLLETDAALAEQIAAEQAALARQLAAAGVDPAASSPTVVGDVSVVTVNCPSGGTITVAESIGGAVQQLLDAAGADGVPLCGWGYRSSDEQIALRRDHCGTSDYAIYDMPSYECSPPTARPGSSQHELGLAIDFTLDGGSLGCSGAGFNWLDSNAAGYGLYNLPSECWHWSTTGN
jgi:LAS superfamily LD-carboxypeptidase LdcB